MLFFARALKTHPLYSPQAPDVTACVQLATAAAAARSRADKKVSSYNISLVSLGSVDTAGCDLIRQKLPPMAAGAAGVRGPPAAGEQRQGVAGVTTRHRAPTACRAEACNRRPPNAFKMAQLAHIRSLSI